MIETGVLHEVGLRNTLEPDPDNTGVGSFRSRTALFLESQREFSCFSQCSGSPIALPRNHCPQVAFSLRKSRLVGRAEGTELENRSESKGRPMQQFAAAVTACMPRQSSAACGFLVKALMPACWLAVAAGVFAQSTAPAGTAQAPANPVSSGPSNQAAPAQQVPRVTTTVVVHSESQGRLSSRHCHRGYSGWRGAGADAAFSHRGDARACSPTRARACSRTW